MYESALHTIPSDTVCYPAKLTHGHILNLLDKKVDYIFVAKPWPIELTWMLNHQDTFQLVFSDKDCNIFKYTGKIT